jgi:hypothetical protein
MKFVKLGYQNFKTQLNIPTRSQTEFSLVPKLSSSTRSQTEFGNEWKNELESFNFN